MKGNCDICGAEIEIKMCCSGMQCGCMGLPIDPPICGSLNCEAAYARKIRKYTQWAMTRPILNPLHIGKPIIVGTTLESAEDFKKLWSNFEDAGRSECTCELPYVKAQDSNGVDICDRCRGSVWVFTGKEEETCINNGFNGSEYKEGDVVKVIGKGYRCLVKIIKYDAPGWYVVQLPNGAYHETRILGEIYKRE